MKIKEALAYLEKQIKELEKGTYYARSVIIPRYEADLKILERMKQQHLRLDALRTKEEAGEEISRSEIKDAVPEEFW